MGISVQEMYLFDAVDRSFWMDSGFTKVIPSNVVKAFHAMRDPAAGSRRTFGNCGIADSGGNLSSKFFFTTHGGVGGWPNGKSKVKPGMGPEDYAYRMMPPGAGALAYTLDYNRQSKCIHEFKEPFPTNVTPEKESQGMESAINWMYGDSLSSL